MKRISTGVHHKLFRRYQIENFQEKVFLSPQFTGDLRNDIPVLRWEEDNEHGIDKLFVVKVQILPQLHFYDSEFRFYISLDSEFCLKKSLLHPASRIGGGQ